MFQRSRLPMKKRSILWAPFICAVLLCVANVFKPATIDDFAYLCVIQSILDNPAQPYGPPPDGFQLIWFDAGQGAFTLLIPMALPYWLALGASLFGQNLVLLKLWLFPFCLIFTLALSSLLRRFAPGYVKPLLIATVFSPAILPGLNVMLDIPALALSLAAIAVFIKAVVGQTFRFAIPKRKTGADGKTGMFAPRVCRWALVMLAGLLAGLAAQTKYTGMTATAVIFLCALLQRRWVAGIVAVTISVLVIASWEGYLANVYGRSHFLEQVDQHRNKAADEDKGDTFGRLQKEVEATYEEKKGLFAPLFCNLGGMTLGLTGILLAALRFRRIALITVGVLLIGFALTAIIPDSWVLWNGDPERQIDDFVFGATVLGVTGTTFALFLSAAIGYLAIRGWSRFRLRVRWNREVWFLIGWLAIELLAYFALSPFAAVRRVLGIFIAATLIGGRLLSVTGRSAAQHRLVNAFAALSAGMGILFAWTDYRSALIDMHAVRDSVAWIRHQPGGDGPIWFSGHWGLQYYGVQQGLHEIYPETSIFKPGDWIIYPDSPERADAHQLLVLNSEQAEPMVFMEWCDGWPWRTIPEYYLGYQPIRRHEGSRLHLTIFLVKKKFQAAPPQSE